MSLLISIILALSGTAAAAECLPWPRRDVLQAPHGYIILSLNAFVEHERAKPSGDDGYWICTNERGDADFYAPRDPEEEEAE